MRGEADRMCRILSCHHHSIPKLENKITAQSTPIITDENKCIENIGFSKSGYFVICDLQVEFISGNVEIILTEQHNTY